MDYILKGVKYHPDDYIFSIIHDIHDCWCFEQGFRKCYEKGPLAEQKVSGVLITLKDGT